MPTLQIIITDAGRQAIVDETNAATLPVTLTEVAVGTGRWSPDATATALQTELKRISTVGGLAVAPDTLHVTITDDSSDVYSLGEFGLYTDSGVLFAIYSDLNGITDKAADALLLIATDVVMTSVPPGSVTVNGVGFSNPSATEALAGVAEVATQTETDTGTDDTRIVTPQKLIQTATTTATANRIVKRDTQGDVHARMMRSEYAVRNTPSSTSGIPFKNNDSTDNYLRFMTQASLQTFVGLPAGTRMLFQQSNAPVGWTKDTTHNNKALRIVSGTVSSGGSQDFTTAFASGRGVSSTTTTGTVGGTTTTGSISSATVTGSVGNTTLSSIQVPAHSHNILMTRRFNGTGRSDEKHVNENGSSTIGTQNWTTDSVGNSGAHNHPLTMNAHNHSLTMNAHNHSLTMNSHNHSISMDVKYVDFIIAQKD